MIPSLKSLASGPFADLAARLGRLLAQHGLNFERFAAHLRLGILTPRESWVLRKFAAISGGSPATAFINDLKNNLTTALNQTIQPIVGSGTLTGTAVDMVDTDGPCFGLLVTGAVSAGTTAPSLAVKYTECDTAGGTYSDITGATHATVTTANQCTRVNFKRSKRFIKAVGTMTGTAPTVAFAVVVEGMKKDY